MISRRAFVLVTRINILPAFYISPLFFYIWKRRGNGRRKKKITERKGDNSKSPFFELEGRGKSSLVSSFLFFYIFSFLIFFTFFLSQTILHNPKYIPLYILLLKYILYYNPNPVLYLYHTHSTVIPEK